MEPENGRKVSVAIIGAGPVGLAAAAHALERGLEPIVFEAGPTVGHAVRSWGHVQMFSPWEYNIDRASERLLAPTGWNAPDPGHYPSGSELLDGYLEPLATRTKLKQRIHLSTRVTGISRAGFDKVKTKGRAEAPFEVRYANGAGPRTMRADAVIDASGTWFAPNPAGANGLPAIGEAESIARVAYAMPDVLGRDRNRYAGKTVAVLGAGHSAIGTLIDLARLAEEVPGTRPVWLLRGNDPAKSFGGGANDKLAARGALVVVDELIVATGFRADLGFLSEVRLALDPALECPPMLAPLIDPNEHSCGTVRPHGARELAQPEPGFYFAGMKSYGRAPTFLMLTGYEQVRSITAAIAGDHEAASRVELVLPETGVCSGPSETEAASVCCDAQEPAKAGCCGPSKAAPAQAAASVCCGSATDVAQPA
jgi:hypothetical protein